jgi:hypothetical protein
MFIFFLGPLHWGFHWPHQILASSIVGATNIILVAFIVPSDIYFIAEFIRTLISKVLSIAARGKVHIVPIHALFALRAIGDLFLFDFIFDFFLFVLYPVLRHPILYRSQNFTKATILQDTTLAVYPPDPGFF